MPGDLFSHCLPAPAYGSDAGHQIHTGHKPIAYCLLYWLWSGCAFPKVMATEDMVDTNLCNEIIKNDSDGKLN